MSTSTPVSMRLAEPDDAAFLFRLFSSTRRDEFQLLGDAAQIDSLMRMQFDLQRRQYEYLYPEAEHSIIVRDGQPAGRLLVNDGEVEIALVDIALLPEWRANGIGSHLLAQLLSRAAAARKPVRLHVLKSNRARRLYERLGFVIVGEDGMYFEMLCAPQPTD